MGTGMSKAYVKRRLICDDKVQSEAEVLERGAVIIVLAEPGAGKTELLKYFGTLWGVTPIRGSIFRHRSPPVVAAPLIIDALDEVAKIDQASIDAIVVRAQEVSNGQVIFASRSYEWAEARTRFVSECFNKQPVVVRIEPFSQEEQKHLFEAHLPGEDFETFLCELDRFELTPLLGNPQFLQLFADAFIQSGRKFSSKSQIFNDAVQRLSMEAGADTTRTSIPTDEVLALASEVMAKVLLSGAAGVSTREHSSSRDYPFLPVMTNATHSMALNILNTKLFKLSSEIDSHEPAHRIVAEYCGADYVVKRVSNARRPLSLKRLLAVIAPNGTVRDELRGLLGWMASLGPEKIQKAAIDLDPYAVLSNGDPSSLTNSSKKALLEGLVELYRTNPGFRRSDHWRRFSVGGFFSRELVPHVQSLLKQEPKGSELVDLLLELLSNSGAPTELVDDVLAILFDPEAPGYSRIHALRAIRRFEVDNSVVLSTLLKEKSASSILLAAELVFNSPDGEFADDEITRLFKAFSDVRSGRKMWKDDAPYMASHYISEIITRQSAAQLCRHINKIVSDISCVCGKDTYECECRSGLSKVAGLLLNGYFNKLIGPHHPDCIWEWLKPLWFNQPVSVDSNASVAVLNIDASLRHEIHWRVLSKLTSEREIFDQYFHFLSSRTHSGLAYRDDDLSDLSARAFEANNVALWSAFWAPPRRDSHDTRPDPFRRLLRQHANSDPLFSGRWAQLERSHRRAWSLQRKQFGSGRFKWGKRRRDWERENTERLTAKRADFSANLAQIRAGQHLAWILRLSRYLLFEPNRIAEFTGDTTLVEKALQNSIALLRPHTPSLSQLARGEGTDLSYALFAACWFQFREEGTLAHIDREVLTAARIQAGKYHALDEELYPAFEAEIDRLVFPSKEAAQTFVKEYIEPGMSGARDDPTHVWWLGNHSGLSALKGGISIEWLQKYPQMPVNARNELFDIAARNGDSSSLRSIIRARLEECQTAVREPTEDDEEENNKAADRRFWELRRFFFESDDDDGWQDLANDKDVIFLIHDRAGRYRRGGDKWPTLSAAKVAKILRRFVGDWKPVHLPSAFGSGDPPEQVAWRFLTEIVWTIGSDIPERALSTIATLVHDEKFSSFKSALLTQQAEARRKLSLSSFEAPAPNVLSKMIDKNGIASVEDLRAFLVEELDNLQLWIRTTETNPLRTFYDGGRHVDENTARDRVVDNLSRIFTAMDLPINVEHQMADSNRCDFTISAMVEGRRRLMVVEAKGQWHPELYTAASQQLDRRYSSHHDAERQGIYLVFWFGSELKVAGRQRHGITSAEALKSSIITRMPEDLRHRIDVIVLDVSR